MEESISNSFEFHVEKLEQLEEDGYKVWKIGFKMKDANISIMALDNSEISRHSKEVSALFNIAKQIEDRTERNEALTKAWSLKRKFAPVDYSYAVSSHKAQGATFNTVIVDEGDIMSVSLISNRMKSHSMYVAISRAAVTSIIIDGQDPEGYLEKAIELSVSKL